MLVCAAATETSTATEARRNEQIDVVRLFAAASVVFVHASKSPALVPWCHALRFAVPFFLFASLYFQSLSLRRKPDRPLQEYIWARIKRLYLPFLAWSVIYLGARDIKHLALLNLGAIEFHYTMLWAGTAYHLYFLPLLLAFSIVLATAHWGLLRHNRVWRWPLIAVAIAAGLAVAFTHMPSQWDERFPSTTYSYVWAWRGLPAGFWALAFAWFMTMGEVVYNVPITLGLAGIGLTVICSVQQAFHGIQLISRALTGLGTFLAALAPWNWSGPTFALLARWGRYGYGIYLCHVLVVEAIRALAARLLHLGPSLPLDFVIFIFGFFGSVALVLIIGKSPRTAWLNG
jgi:peptidoglycan/LPS O-acetylase OafA/YrhL